MSKTAEDSAFNIQYRFRNHDLSDPTRTVHVEAKPEEIRQILDEGYLVRERLISGELLQRLRDAVDEIAEEEREKQTIGGSNRFGGLFVRNLMDRHPTFLEMLKYQPTLSVARALLGPQVQVHAMVMRVCYPGELNQETHWHFHQRVIPDPLPPFFTRPHVIDNLIYLDDVDLPTGPLTVVPRTHLRDDDLPGNDHSVKPGQVTMEVPAGSVVTAPASLWHRAMPTTPEGHVRRLVILGYSPTWMKQVDKTGLNLTKPLIENGDWEERELLGFGGYY